MVARGLALAEAKLGDCARAAERIESVIAQAVELGIVGLNLGVLYEARTRIALWAGDRTALERRYKLSFRSGEERGPAVGAYNFGILLEQCGDVEGAEAAYRRADVAVHVVSVRERGFLL